MNRTSFPRKGSDKAGAYQSWAETWAWEGLGCSWNHSVFPWCRVPWSFGDMAELLDVASGQVPPLIGTISSPRHRGCWQPEELQAHLTIIREPLKCIGLTQLYKWEHRVDGALGLANRHRNDWSPEKGPPELVQVGPRPPPTPPLWCLGQGLSPKGPHSHTHSGTRFQMSSTYRAWELLLSLQLPKLANSRKTEAV